MSKFEELDNKIRTLKGARDILEEEYKDTDFHKERESHPQSKVPPKPEDEDVYKLLTAIQQLEEHIKKLQDDQFKILKQQEEAEE
ncbi:MAG: hypothetical protein V5A64_01185 [Candidatus Thermoplasmatota archaeon]